MVDKYSAKEYVSNLIGSEYIIPTLGVWDSFDDIDFSKLPNQFVLKCTHDSGGLVICRDKKALDLSKTRAKIEKSLKKTTTFPEENGHIKCKTKNYCRKIYGRQR